MNISQTLRWSSKNLSPSSPTPQLDSEILLAHCLKKDKVYLRTHPKQTLSPIQVKYFKNMVGRRQKKEPIAYILGYKEFYGLKFKVNKYVLIPRPETELLVEEAIKIEQQNRKHSLTVADIGTGSGCVITAFLKNLRSTKKQITAYATDISAEALRIAKQNATEHGQNGIDGVSGINGAKHQLVRLHRLHRLNRLDRSHTSHNTTLHFLQGDLLTPIPEKLDLILTNLPYIPTEEIPYLDPNVKNYEPRTALDGGVKGLKVINRFFTQVPKKLKKGGTILMEIHHKHGEMIKRRAKIALGDNVKVEIKKDYTGLDRLAVIEI